MSQTKILNLEPTYAANGPPIKFRVKLPPVPEALHPDSVAFVVVTLDVESSQFTDAIAVATLVSENERLRWSAFVMLNTLTTWTVSGDHMDINFSAMPFAGPHEVITNDVTARQRIATQNRQSFAVAGTVPEAPETEKDLADIVIQHGSLPVSLRARGAQQVPEEEVHWIRILAASKAFGYDVYRDYVKAEFCLTDPAESPEQTRRGRHAFGGVRAYERLRDVTEHFVQSTCEKIPEHFVKLAIKEALARLDRQPDVDTTILNDVVPQNVAVTNARLPRVAEAYRIACLERLDWCPIELIWCHWMESGMLVQTMNTIARRFQNLRVGQGRDPLANFEIAPLRALNHLLFGYVQDDTRLTVLRRAHEYVHEYGLDLQGKAVRWMRPADRRSKFLESFHNLLLRCTHFYRQLDDLTVRADAFPVLNAIKETHYLLAQGAHNQIGELPQVARQQMMLEQYLLGTSEMRDFLHTRDSVPYTEDWMGRVDAMKNLYGWIDTSVVHFRDLAVSSEVLVQSVRYGGWAKQNDAEVARTWAMLFRTYIQVYLHAYRAVTGVELTSEVSHPRQALLRAASPSEHLQRRLAEQTTRALR